MKWLDSERFRPDEDKVLLFLTLVIGAVVGLVVVAFILVTENLTVRFSATGGSAWRRVLLPVLGALAGGVLLRRYFPDARGSGIPQTKTALFLRDGFIPFRTVLGKFACSSITLASGIALGREGPSVQVGAGIASSLGRQLGLSPARIKELIPVGTSAAIAAAFNTPIAAVTFTLEEILANLHAPLLGPVVLGSVTSWIVLRLLLGDEPLFHVPAYQLVHPLEFGIFALLGVVGGLVSVGLVKLLLFLREFFLKLPPHTQWIQPAAGGLLVGLLGWGVPSVMGVGYSHVSEALNGQMALGLMAALVFLKVVATAGSYASGNAGGIFGPALFIGAMTGGAIGAGSHYFLPDYTGSVGSYALVGMGVAFAGIIRAPLTSVIMIFEITRDYSIVVPVMLANLVSFFISRRFQPAPIYEALQHQEGIHLPPGGGSHDALLLTKEAMSWTPQLLAGGDKVTDMAALLQQGTSDAWMVTDERRLLGVIRASRLQRALTEGRQEMTLRELLADPGSEGTAPFDRLPVLHTDDPLDTALRRMGETGFEVLPVVSRADLRELLGVISRGDILDAYGLGKEKPARPPAVPARSATTVAGLLALTVTAVALIGFFTYVYRVQRADRAAGEYQAGRQLLEEGRSAEAVERFRNALSVSHRREHRQALALALARSGRLNEAQVYLQELLREDPVNGVVNLELARLAEKSGRIQEAVSYYRRAVNGTWEVQSEAHESRIQARLELADLLARTGLPKQAVTELEALLEGTPASDAVLRRKIGGLVMTYGAPRDAADLYRNLLRLNRDDLEALKGLGEAELAQDHFVPAWESFHKALRLDPSDSKLQRQARLCDEIVALDPAVSGIGSAERFRRSRILAERALASLDLCVAAAAAPADDLAAAETARQTLTQQSRPRSYTDAAEAHLSQAQQLWSSRGRICGSPPESDAAVARILGSLQR